MEALRAFPSGEESPAKTALEDQLAAIVRDLEPIFIGPTWKKNSDGSWFLPEHSLGWEILGWCSKYLRDFNDESKPLRLTPEQARFILWWYAIDERGKWIYNTGTLQRMKGHGKDPLLAVMCLVEWVGPCRFSHWDERTGKPVARPEPHSFVQIAATSLEQTHNTAQLFSGLMSPRLRSEYRVEKFSVASEKIRAGLDGRQQIKLVTSNPKSLEGNRSTFVLLNETHHWTTSNHGVGKDGVRGMYETIDGNVTKGGGKGARYLAITNAYLPGEDSAAERMREEYEEIAERPDFLDFGILYDSIEAHPMVPMHPVALKIVVPKICGDAWWLDPESILKSIRKKSIPSSQSRRMWLNQIVAAEDAMWSELDWKALQTDLYLQPGDNIVLGLDGAKSDDSTALIAVRIKDMLVVPLGIWEKDGDNWIVPRQAVHSAVAGAFKSYNVKAFFADSAHWADDISEWHDLYVDKLDVRATDAGNAIEWDMRNAKRSTMAHHRLVSAIENRKIKFSPMNDPRLHAIMRRHFLNTYRDENNFGVYVRKISRESPRKIDAYQALIAAFEALTKYRIKGKKPDAPRGRTWFF